MKREREREREKERKRQSDKRERETQRERDRQSRREIHTTINVNFRRLYRLQSVHEQSDFDQNVPPAITF